MKLTYVYGLYEGFSNIPFYIGVSVEPKRRLAAHKAALDGRRKDALSGTNVLSKDVTMRLLAQCDDRGHAEHIEKALQVYFGIKVVTTERLIIEPENDE
jgi:predicted GIY-YIG superfamily endonuclease